MAILDSLIAYYKLDEASDGSGAVTRNDSHGANHLTDNNTVTSTTGKLGDAGQFVAANNEYLSRADNADLSTGDIDFTVTAWVYLDTTVSTRAIVSKIDTGAANTEYWFQTTGLNRWDFVLQESGGSAKSVTVPGPVATDTWYFVVAWYDSSANTINMQVNNGTVASTASVNPPGETPGTFRIGTLTPGTRQWDGRIDAVGFWKRVLTESERTQLYNDGDGLEYPFATTYTQAVSATGTFAASIVKSVSKTLSATGSWLATLLGTHGPYPTVRIATRPAEDRTAVVPARVTITVDEEE